MPKPAVAWGLFALAIFAATCAAAWWYGRRGKGVPLFVKQLHIDRRVSHDPAEWPEDLRIREFPEA